MPTRASRYNASVLYTLPYRNNHIIIDIFPDDMPHRLASHL